MRIPDPPPTEQRVGAVTNLLEGIPPSWKNQNALERSFSLRTEAAEGVWVSSTPALLLPSLQKLQEQKIRGTIPKGGDVGTGCRMR